MSESMLIPLARIMRDFDRSTKTADETIEALESIGIYVPNSPNLFGKRAEHSEFGTVIVLDSCPDHDGDVKLAYLKSEEDISGRIEYGDIESLRFLDEENPARTVFSSEAYENLPIGSIVGYGDGQPSWFKRSDGLWYCPGFTESFSSDALAGMYRDVLFLGGE